MNRTIVTATANAVVGTLLVSTVGGGLSAVAGVREFGTVLESTVQAGLYVWLVVVPLAIGVGVVIGIGVPATAFVRTGSRARVRFLLQCGGLGIVGAVVLWPFAALGGAMTATWTVHWLNGAPVEQVWHFIVLVLEIGLGWWSFAHVLVTAIAAAGTAVVVRNRVGPDGAHRVRYALLVSAIALILCAIACTAHARYLNRPVNPPAAHVAPLPGDFGPMLSVSVANPERPASARVRNW